MGKVIFGATFTLDQTVKKSTVPESGGTSSKSTWKERGGAQMRTFRGKEEGIQSASIMRFRGSCNISPKCEVIMPDLI